MITSPLASPICQRVSSPRPHPPRVFRHLLRSLLYQSPSPPPPCIHPYKLCSLPPLVFFFFFTNPDSSSFPLLSLSLLTQSLLCLNHHNSSLLSLTFQSDQWPPAIKSSPARSRMLSPAKSTSWTPPHAPPPTTTSQPKS